MMSHLYDIAERFNNINELMLDPDLDAGGEITAALEAVRDEELIPKAENLVYVIRNIEARQAAAKREKERFAKQEGAYGANVVRLKAYLKDCLEVAGLTNVDCGLVKLHIQKNGQCSLVISDERVIDEKFFITPPPELSKAAIREALESGAEVKGAELVQGTHLRIS